MPQRDTKSTKKWLTQFVPFVFVCAFLCTSAAAVKGASLFGKVIEVQSGDVITIVQSQSPGSRQTAGC